MIHKITHRDIDGRHYRCVYQLRGDVLQSLTASVYAEDRLLGRIEMSYGVIRSTSIPMTTEGYIDIVRDYVAIVGEVMESEGVVIERRL